MDLFGEAPRESPAEAAIIPDIDVAQDTFTTPRQMRFISGHADVETHLLELFKAGTIPHGLVFSGLKGIGKATLAYRFARFLFKNGGTDPNQDSLFGDSPAEFTTLDVPDDDQVFAQVASGGHPDLFVVERVYDPTKNRYKTNVDVAEIRKVGPFLRMTAAEGGWRVVIIDDADTMNRNAQNALLKILEEPPEQTVIILVTHRVGALIPTIRSRTRTISFQALTRESISDLLNKSDFQLSENEKHSLIELSNGSFGQALHYAEEGVITVFDKIIEAFAAYPSWNWVSLHTLSEELGRPGQDKSYTMFQDLLMWLLQSLVQAKARSVALSYVLDQQSFQNILKNASLDHLLKMHEEMEAHFAKANVANLDKKQVVLGAFSLIS